MEIDSSLYWWAAAFLLLFIELYFRELTFLILSAALMVAAITVAVGLPLPVQILVIALVTIPGFKFFRPWALQYIPETARHDITLFPTMPMSAKEAKPVRQRSVTGQAGTALTVIDRYGGVVRIGKEDWQAKLNTNTATASIAKGSHVYVVATEGTIAVVAESDKVKR